ncbi:hypothetical protein [Ochrobactrum sp. EDr1-4]|uniref:hypothetical protein n=1 Tax=Ochrobactrum sp. EDr1-4 TaxID=3368622 RepID=UPI003BA133CC
MTAERVENALDILANIMAGARNGEAALGAPLWQRLESELEGLRDVDDIVAKAIKRVERLIKNV